MVLQLWFRLMIPQFLEEMAHRHIHKRTSVPLSVLSFLAHGLEAWVLVFGKGDIVSHSRTEIRACLSAVFPDKWVGYVRFNFGKEGTLSHSQTEIHACLSPVFPGKWIWCVKLNFGKYGTLSHSQTEIHACLSTIFPGKWIWCVRHYFVKYGTLSYFSNENSFLSQPSPFWQMVWMRYT